MNDFTIEEANRPLKHAVEKIPNNYQKYLFDSKMRNQKLREINERELKKGTLCHREQEFSLYFNGANSETCGDLKVKLTSIAPRKSKTSDDTPGYERMKTAPGRKRWGSPTKIGFFTERGERMFVKPIDYYSEDFDEEIKTKVDGKEDNSDVEQEIEEDICGEISVDLSIDDVRSLRQSLVRARDVRNNTISLCTIEEGIGTINNSIIENTNETLKDDFEDYDCTLSRTEDLSEVRLKQILDRIVKMSADQQKRLLNSLETIEEKFTDTKNVLTLYLIIESNWGHDERVGLTELALWTSKKEILKIRSVKASQDVRKGTAIESVIDGKKDTAKEKHMWSCDFSEGRSVRIDCLVEADSLDDVQYLAIWNYNRSLETLSIGARVISLWNGDTLIFRGVVEKALGNAAFNPPTVIELKHQERNSALSLDSSLEISSDDECLLDKLRNAQKSTYIKEDTDMSSRKSSARYGRRSEMGNNEERDQLKELVEQFERETLMPKQSFSLEQSWTSLNHFNQSHAGRLSIDQTEDFIGKIIEEMKGTDEDINQFEEFVIPELPEGKYLVINIITTWGDPHYVGLTGIEMFSANGDRIKAKQILADPADVNVLPGYGDDPRVVSNLLDGVNKTRDDVHMWLAPFTKGQNHFVKIEFAGVFRLAFLRIWNYNKSRIHSSRGARDVEITLDERLIFKGEIIRAPGSQSEEDWGEVILFTGDDSILDLIGQNDDEFNAQQNIDESDLEMSIQANEFLASLALRPPTAKETSNNDESNDAKILIYRPFTGIPKPNKVVDNKNNSSIIRMEITETWGDMFYVGLTGLQLLDDSGDVITIDTVNVSCSIEPLENDSRTLDKIFDGVNLTVDDDHMWLIPFSPEKEHIITITLMRPQRVRTLRIWNYNKSVEDSYRGVKILQVWTDTQKVSPETGFLLRRAPGHVLYEFVQEVSLWGRQSVPGVPEAPHLPCGFVYQLNLFSAWNDLYYVGLTGLELFDEKGGRLEVGPGQVYAHPDSVNALATGTGAGLDVRTPDKLVNGANDGYDPKDMWLAPILPGRLNRIFVVFDRPVAVSMVRLWNYGKTPARGLKDFSVQVDDLLIHSGVLPAAPSAAACPGILPHLRGDRPANPHWTVLFDRGNPRLMAAEHGHLLLPGNGGYGGGPGAEVVLTNDNDILATVVKDAHPNQKFRPATSVNRDRNNCKA